MRAAVLMRLLVLVVVLYGLRSIAVVQQQESAAATAIECADREQLRAQAVALEATVQALAVRVAQQDDLLGRPLRSYLRDVRLVPVPDITADDVKRAVEAPKP